MQAFYRIGTMKIRLEEISEGGSRFRETNNAAWLKDLIQLDEDEAFRAIGDASFDFELKKSSSRIRVTGYIRAKLGFTCSRCLKEQETEITVRINEHFTAEDVDYVVTEGDPSRAAGAGWESLKLLEIDLGHLMADHFRMALPMAPVCDDSENCREGSMDIVHEVDMSYEEPVNLEWKEGLAAVKRQFSRKKSQKKKQASE